MSNEAAERAWRWVFEFTGTEPTLDPANSNLFDQKINWLLDNETDDNILRTFVVLRENVPPPSVYGGAKDRFDNKFGIQVIQGVRGGPWEEGFERPEWAKRLKTPIESLS